MQRDWMATGWKRLSCPVSPVRMRQGPLYCRTAGCDSGAVSRSKYSFLSAAESAAGAGNRIDEGPSGWQFYMSGPYGSGKTHLWISYRTDDLNTYAFLDLVIGLLESDSCKRQFIISTCDEKLLQLAIQKFGHLGDRAVFYRFDAIGSNGPVVDKLSQS